MIPAILLLVEYPRRSATLLVATLLCSIVLANCKAQTAASAVQAASPAFEVATIKPVKILIQTGLMIEPRVADSPPIT